MKLPRILITAMRSGAGKTMLTCGILKAMKMQEINPASFKCGPDYIDPMFHKTVIGISSYNLDSFLCGENGVREILKKNGAGADISVMEGVMGYYDGIAGISSEASAYDIARITDTPAVMILDCKGLSVSAVPCIQGFLHYKEDSNLAPVTPINMTSCYFMFAGCSKLIQLDLSGFDTRNVIDMRCMFEDCLRLTKLDLSSFKTSKVTLMISMFNSCVSLIQLDLSSFDTSSVISMSGMFYNCFSLAALNISNFNTSSVTEMDCMFTGCSNLVQLDVSKFDTSKVVTMFCMFSGCYKLIQLNLSNFDTKRVTNMASLFHNCQALAKLDISSFDTSQVTDMGAMFTYCSKLTQLDFTLFDTRNVTDTRWMFEHCEKLTTIFISDKWSMDRVTNAMDMFKECCSLPGFSPEKTGIEMAKPTEQGGYLTLKK